MYVNSSARFVKDDRAFKGFASSFGPDPVASARGYGQAKSRQDVAAALAFCTPEFVMEAVPFGTRASGRAEVASDLRAFFEMFPDYRFVCASVAKGDDTVVLTGHAQMTWTGRIPRALLGSSLVRLPSRKIEVPATAVFETRGGLLSREQFFFDMADFCRQIGLPVAVVRALLGRLESRRSAKTTLREENGIFVPAPPEAVFDFALADVTQLLRANNPWPLPRATRIELAAATEVTEGAVRQVHVSNGHVTRERIVACERPKRLAYRIENGWGFPVSTFVAETYGEHTLEAVDGGTRLVWRGFVVPRHALTTPIAGLLIRLLLRPMQKRFLRSVAAAFGVEAAVGAAEAVDRP